MKIKEIILLVSVTFCILLMTANCVSAGDGNPPASVTALDNSSIGGNSITWSWTNPSDADFNHTMIYLNNTFMTNVSNGSNSYVASGLFEKTEYTISTRTVDFNATENLTWVNNTAITLDLTAPMSVTGLAESTVTNVSITWGWTNPLDSDFNHTMVYVDNVFATNVSNGSNSYIASSLSELTEYTISTKSVDIAGNVNSTWVNDSATTLDLTAPASVTALAESTVSTTAITWGWTNPGNSDFNHTMVYVDNVFTTNVSNGSSSYATSGLTASTLYTISTRTVDITGNVNLSWVNDTATTSAVATTSSSSGGGGGTGSATIVDNIETVVEDPVVEETSEPVSLQMEDTPEPELINEPADNSEDEPVPEEPEDDSEDTPGFSALLMSVGLILAVYCVRRA